MEMPWFCWNGRDSRAMGVTLAEFPAAGAPAERTCETAVPGRPGTLTLAGSDGPDTLRLSLRLLVLPEACLPAVVAWLRGSGRLILSTEADREMSGRVEGAIRFVHAGGGWHAGAVSFRLQPGKAAVPPEADITVTAAGTAVYNPGDLPARPVYRLRGSGRMELRLRPAETCASLCVDPAGDERLAGLDGAVIDTDSMTVTDPDGAESLSAVTAFVRGDVSGLWIPPHAAVIVDAGFADASGATDSVVITPRWRWL